MQSLDNYGGNSAKIVALYSNGARAEPRRLSDMPALRRKIQPQTVVNTELTKGIDVSIIIADI
jgi:hypothetical protein